MRAGEQRDLAKTETAKTKELTALLHSWRTQVGAEMPTPNPKYKEGMKWPGNGIKGENDSPYDKEKNGE